MFKRDGGPPGRGLVRAPRPDLDTRTAKVGNVNELQAQLDAQQAAEDGSPEGTPPTIESSGGREGKFRAKDGAVIRYAWWRGTGAASNGTAVYFNGRTEFIEKTIETVQELRTRGFDVWTLDWRGQGLSQRALANRHKGHIEDYRQHLNDLRLFFRDYVDPKARGRQILLAHSMGGHIALRLLHDMPERFERAVLSSPMVDIHGSNALVRGGLGMLGWLGGWPALAKAYIPGTGDYGTDNRRFDGNVLTSDETRFGAMHAMIDANPDLALGGPTLGWLHASRRSIAILNDPAYAQAIATPVLIVSAADDTVVSNKAQRAIRPIMPNCRLETIDGAKHEILIEREELRAQFWRLFDDFLGGGEVSPE